MRRPRSWPSDAQARADADRQTATLAGVAIILLLLVIGLFLVHALHGAGKIEDCLMAGRRDCDHLVTGGR